MLCAALMWIRWQYYGQFGSYGPPLFFVGLSLLLISSVFVSALATGVYRDYRLATAGVATTGIIVKKMMHPASDSGTRDTSYEVQYTYTTADGRAFAGTEAVDAATWDAVRVGGRVPIEYARTEPSMGRIGARPNAPAGGAVALGSGLVLWIFGAVLAIRGARMWWRQSARARHGDVSAALEGKPGRTLLAALAFMQRWVSLLTVSASVMFILGAVFFPLGLAVMHRESLFHSEGEIADATVLTKSSRYEQQQSGGSEWHYYVGYRFDTHQGVAAGGTDEVSRQTWQSVRERDSVPIVYLHDRPQQNRLLANDPGRLPWIFSVLGGILLAAGALSWGYIVLSSMRSRRTRSTSALDLH